MDMTDEEMILQNDESDTHTIRKQTVSYLRECVKKYNKTKIFKNRIKNIYKLKKQKIIDIILQNKEFMYFYENNMVIRVVSCTKEDKYYGHYDELWGSETSFF